jgi:hypothetical protein
MQGQIQDFKLGGDALKKIVASGGRRENFWGISCEKSRFYAKKSFFFQGGGSHPVPLDPPLIYMTTHFPGLVQAFQLKIAMLN